jgi:hypothetical protein
VVASRLPILDFSLHELSDPESMLLALAFTGLFNLPFFFMSAFKKVSIAFLRTVVMFFFDLYSAGAWPVMKIRLPSLSGSFVAIKGVLSHASHLNRAIINHVNRFEKSLYQR